MFLRHIPSGGIVEILDLETLTNPFKNEVKGRFHAGDEVPPSAGFRKSDMEFLSNERLPRCWIDQHYKERKI